MVAGPALHLTVVLVTHDDFVKMAEEAAKNAQGLRPLANHVRQLHQAIRQLQVEDNSFFYIAEVIQQGRGDKTDAIDFMQRVKTYYHRDRKRAGYPLVNRGMALGSPELAAKRSGNMTTPANGSASAARDIDKTISSHSRPNDQVSSGDFPSIAPNEQAKDDVAADMRALTTAVNNRHGRRRTVSGG